MLACMAGSKRTRPAWMSEVQSTDLSVSELRDWESRAVERENLHEQLAHALFLGAEEEVAELRQQLKAMKGSHPLDVPSDDVFARALRGEADAFELEEVVANAPERVLTELAADRNIRSRVRLTAYSMHFEVDENEVEGLFFSQDQTRVLVAARGVTGAGSELAEWLQENPSLTGLADVGTHWRG